MFELLKKTIYAGIGAAAITRKNVEKVLHELVEQGKLTKGEAENLAEDIVNEGRKEFHTTKKKINANVQEWLNEARLVTEDDLKKLEQRVKSLEGKVAHLKRVHEEEKPAPGGP